MRARYRLLWMTIPLLLVACNWKDGASRSAVSEHDAETLTLVGERRSADGTSYSSAIVGDSVVVTIGTSAMADSAHSYTESVTSQDSVSHSKVSYSSVSIKVDDEASISVDVEDSCQEDVSAESVADSVCVYEDFVSDSICWEHPSTESVSDSLIGGASEQVSDSLVSAIDTLELLPPAELLLHEKMDTSTSDNCLGTQVQDYVAQRGMIRRDAAKTLFIPKGQWMLGGQLSWKQWDNDNLSYLLLQDLNFAGHTFSVGPYLGYFFAKNMAVGARFSYSRSYLNVDEVGMSLGEGLSFSLSDFYYLQHGYRSTVFLRSYIPIGESKIFGLFGELQLNHTFSEWKCSMGRDDLLQGVYQNTHAVGLGLGGGMVVFLTDFAAAEVMLNVGGCDYKWGYQSIKKIDKIDEGRLSRSSADYRIDLFSIKFGLTFYL